MSVHYKFKSNLDHDTVTFDGLSISVLDLKKSIMHQKKIGKSSDFDLQITNAQTKEVYDNDEILVPKNTSVIVARVPVTTGNKKSWDKPDLPLQTSIDEDDLGQIRYDKIAKSADLVNANATEEDKVKAMITQSSQEYDPSKYVKSRSMTGPLPPTYTCYRCGKQGHWIKNCPTNNPDVKRSTGIPRSFMVPVDGPEHKGALLTSSGEYAVPLIDHQAYKEVKKEKPPFIPQDEPEVESEAQIPEELLCMVCRDLLQDAVLIPCCGNSFCDECVRQVLLESDNHECPLCHETEISPDTVIPNRFLRTAVLNFRNETGYTRVKRLSLGNNTLSFEHRVDSSPQPSPDSTVETQALPTENTVETIVQTAEDIPQNKECCDTKAVTPNLEESHDSKEQQSVDIVDTPDCSSTPKEGADTEIEDTQPGTPLADELPVDVMSQPLPIQTIGQEHYTIERCDYSSGSRYLRHRDEYGSDCRDKHSSSSSSEPKPISIIETITNIRKSKYMGRPAPVRQHFPNQRAHHVERSDNYSVHDRDEYHGRYDRRHHGERTPQRPPHHSRYDRSPRESRYHHSDHEYPSSERDHHDSRFDTHLNVEETVRRHPERYSSPPRPAHLETNLAAPSLYSSSGIAHLQPQILPAAQVFPLQPPPPGSSPISTSHVPAQPPPPGVGPLLPPSISTDPVSNYNLPYDSEDPLKEANKVDDRSIDDRLEAFQRELEKRDREQTRERASRSRSSSSRSRSYTSSKSWTRSPTRSTTRTSRSRSRTPFSSRSRSRSYSRTRSRSWSKPRSYTRSRSRTRTESSRSRSRSRHESRSRCKGGSRDRMRSPLPRSRSHSYSPKDYRMQNHRSSYVGKRSYTPPHYGTSYPAQYGPPPTVLPLPVMRPASYPAHHIHSIHPIPQPLHPRPIEHYTVERPRYPSYNNDYTGYDVYQQKSFGHQRYDREQRSLRYDKRQDYQRLQEEVPHRIPGWVGDRSREYKPRYRQREQQRKEIKELPKVSEPELRVVHSKETSEEIVSKRKEDKILAKHKKHHHHHKNKDFKKQEKQENKIPVVISTEKHSEEPRNLIKVEMLSDNMIETTSSLDLPSKIQRAPEKVKEKKHKHKKHKVGDQSSKKKKAAKKDKFEGMVSADSDVPAKIKTKKRKKLKNVVEVLKQEDTLLADQENTNSPPLVEEQISQLEAVTHDPVETQVLPQLNESTFPNEVPVDTLDIFADDAGSETLIVTSEVPFEPDSGIECKSNPPNVKENTDEVSDHIENLDQNNTEIVNSEEDEEDRIKDESVLHVDIPALSKWEREEFEEDFTSRPQRRSAVIIPKEGKGSLSSDIIQRAEKAILSKPLKTAIINLNKEKGAAKISNKDENSFCSQNVDGVFSKHKEVGDIKSIVSSERLSSPTLQVTISTVKEKRSVRSKKDNSNKVLKEDVTQSKRVKLDRSNFKGATESCGRQNMHRTVTVSDMVQLTKAEEKQRSLDSCQRSSSRREGKRHSAVREICEANLSRDRRDYSRQTERVKGSQYRSEHLSLRDNKRYGNSRNTSEYSGARDSNREKRRAPNEHSSQLRDKRYMEGKDTSRSYEKSKKAGDAKRLRSESYDSSDSYHSYNKKSSFRRHHESVSVPVRNESHQESENRERVRKINSENSVPIRKHSPIKPPTKYEKKNEHSKTQRRDFSQDDLKFEPDYDEYSDVDSKQNELKNKVKHSSELLNNAKKCLKSLDLLSDNRESKSKDRHGTAKSSATSSQSSSAVSDSDSSDTENLKGNKNKNSDIDHKQKHKKSRRKKHKKHKHKHKKKKSHKSK